MSVEYSKRVWQDKELKQGKLLVMLALAHHADDKGECWPGMPLLIDKTRLTDRQIRRVLNQLEKSGHIVIDERAIGRGKRPHYQLFPCLKADIMSEQSEKVDILSQESGNNVHLDDANEEKADISDNKSGHFLHGKADISDTDYSHVRSESPLETSIELTEEEKQAQARDPLSVAWRQAYEGIEMPPKLAKSLQELVKECGMAAAIHGIKASAAKKDGRNFRYIAECARNYVPPPPVASYSNGNGNGYHVDLADVPGVVQLQPTGAAPPVLPPPMAHDDPWAIALAELAPTLPSLAASWLQGSQVAQNGELAGVPLYTIMVMKPDAKPDWLQKQAEPAIRKKLGSILGKRILIEFAVVQGEPA